MYSVYKNNRRKFNKKNNQILGVKFDVIQWVKSLKIYWKFL